MNKLINCKIIFVLETRDGTSPVKVTQLGYYFRLNEKNLANSPISAMGESLLLYHSTAQPLVVSLPSFCLPRSSDCAEASCCFSFYFLNLKTRKEEHLLGAMGELACSNSYADYKCLLSILIIICFVYSHRWVALIAPSGVRQPLDTHM